MEGKSMTKAELQALADRCKQGITKADLEQIIGDIKADNEQA